MKVSEFLTETKIGIFLIGFICVFTTLSVVCLFFGEFNNYIWTILACSLICGIYGVFKTN